MYELNNQSSSLKIHFDVQEKAIDIREKQKI